MALLKPPASLTDAADFLMDDLFERLRELSASGVLPYEQDQAVQRPKRCSARRLLRLLPAC